MMSQSNVNPSDNASSSMNPVSTTIVSSDPDVTNVPQQITQWVDDTAVQHASLPNPVVPSEDILISGSEVRSHNILDVLERPVQLESFDWTDSQSFENVIKSYNFPEALISQSNNINYKINYFTFFRAHVVIRFVVNANTFQAGRLIAFFSPFASETEIGNRTLLNNFMTSYSIFPRIILDAASGNSGELTIPYVSYFTHYDLVKALGDLGTVRIAVLNPLQSGNATVSVFARFTNISLEIPTGLPNTLSPPSSSTLFAKISRMLQLGHVKEKDIDGLLPTAQVGEAVSKASSGVLSSTLTSISNFSSMLSSAPIIGKYLTPISWISKASAQVASYFGLSKPINLQSPNFLINIPGHSFTNADGVDNSIVLGTSCENEIGTRSDLFGSNIDEMDVSFIVAHESYLTSFTWSDANTSGVLLSAVNISPGICAAIGAPTDIFKPTASAFIASMFQYWRGSLKFKIQITKTAYHSGRLRVAFIPGGSLPILNTIDYNQGYSEIVDLRTSDEIVVTIPFVSNTIWKPCELIAFAATGSLPSSIGVLSITVLNQLRHPDTVASSLQCNIWISGGDDLQFSVPDFRNYMPCQIVETMPVAQVLGQFQDVGFNTSMGISNDMFDSKKISPIDACALTIGEHVQNLRTLTRRFGLVADDQLAAGSGKAFKYQTNYFGPNVVSNITPSSLKISPLDYISWLYRFSRGGTRFKCIIRDSVNIGTLRALTIPNKYAKPAPPGQVNQLNSEWARSMSSGGAFMHIIHFLINFISEITVPYFSNTHISLIRGPSDSLVVGANDDRYTDVYWANTGSTNVKFALFKAAADDFSFGWLVGPPALMLRPNLAVYNLNFANATTLEVEDGGVRLFDVVIDPTLALGTYSITAASISSVTLFVTGGIVDIPITTCTIEVTSTNIYFHIPYATPTDVNIITSLAALQALATINVEVSGP